MMVEQNPEWKNFEQTIIELVKEHYRLQELIIVRDLNPEIEALIIGGDGDDPRRDRSVGS